MKTCSESELTDLMCFHIRARKLGEQDEIVLVLVDALIARGDEIGAQNLLTEYLSLRREKFEIRGPLRQRAVRLRRLS